MGKLKALSATVAASLLLSYATPFLTESFFPSSTDKASALETCSRDVTLANFHAGKIRITLRSALPGSINEATVTVDPDLFCAPSFTMATLTAYVSWAFQEVTDLGVSGTFPVQPGQTHVFRSGHTDYNFQVDVFAGGIEGDTVSWPHALIGEQVIRPLGFAPPGRMECVGISAPTTVTAGQQFDATITVRNRSLVPWVEYTVRPNYPVKLGSDNPRDTEKWGVTRIPLGPAGTVVQPGSDHTFRGRFTAPLDAGVHPFAWRMVKEQIGWMDGPGCQQMITVASVPPPPVLTLDGLRGTKTGPATTRRGEEITYRITVYNDHSGTKNGVHAFDNIPAGLSFVRGSDGSRACYLHRFAGDATDTVVCPVGNLAVGESRTVNITFSVLATAACGPFRNAASIAIDGVHGRVVEISPATVDLQCPTPVDPPAVGHHDGGDACAPSGGWHGGWAWDPSRPTVALDMPIDVHGYIDGQFIAAVRADLPRPDLVTARITPGPNHGFVMGIPASYRDGRTHQISFYAIGIDRDGGQTHDNPPLMNTPQSFSCPTTPTPGRLTISKSGPESVARGGEVRYVVTVRNPGPTTHRGVTVYDSLWDVPGEDGVLRSLSVVRTSIPCRIVHFPESPRAGTLECAVGEIPAGVTREVEIVLRVPEQTRCEHVIDNVADIGAIDHPADWSPHVYTRVSCPATHLTVTKTAPASIRRGDTATFTVTVRNATGQTHHDVRVSDITPPNLTFRPDLSDSRCRIEYIEEHPTERIVICRLGTMATGTEQRMTLAFATEASLSCDRPMENVAYVWSQQTPVGLPDASNRTSTRVDCPTTPTPSRLTITKSAPAAVMRGQVATYTLTVRNTSSDTHGTVFVSDATPPHMKYRPELSDSRCRIEHFPEFPSERIVLCRLGAMSPGAVHTVNLAFEAEQTFPCATSATNIAYAWSERTPAGQPDTSNTTSTRVDCVSSSSSSSSGPASRLALTKSVHSSVVMRGQDIIYTLTVRNPGPDSHTDVRVSDASPAHLTFRPELSDSRCHIETFPEFPTERIVVCRVGNMGTGAVHSMNLVFRTENSFPCGTSASNIAYAWSPLTPFGQPDVSNTVTTRVDCAASSSSAPTGLTLSKTDGRSTVQPGEELLYTITVANPTGSPATVALVDEIPSVLTPVTSSPSDGGTITGQIVTWPSFTLAAGVSAVRTFRATVSSSAADGTVIPNVARVNNQLVATDTTTVQRTTTAGLTIDIFDQPDPVFPCERLRYTVRLTNSTTSSITQTVTMTLPSQITRIVDAGGGTVDGLRTITWTNYQVPAQTNRELRVDVDVSCSVRDGDTLIVRVVAGNVTREETTRVREDSASSRRLTISISDTPDPVKPDETLEYRIRLNNDDTRSRTFDVNLFLDPDTTFVSVDVRGTSSFYDSDRYSYTDRDSEVLLRNFRIESRSEREILLKVRVKRGTRDGTQLRLRARADGIEDTEETRVSAAVLPLPPGGNVSLDKRADRFEASPGASVSYTITARNATSTALDGLTLIDTFIPSQMTITDAAGGQVSGGQITWSIGRLEPNQVRTITYRVMLSHGLRHGDRVQNTAILQGAPGNPTSVATISIVMLLPPTGILSFTGPFVDPNAYIRPIGMASSGSATAGILSTMLALGTAAVGQGLKRFFL